MSNNKYSDKDMEPDGTIDGMCNCSTCKEERRRGVGNGMLAQLAMSKPNPPSDSFPLPESIDKLPPTALPTSGIKPRMLPRTPKEISEGIIERATHYQFGENGEYEVFKVLDAWGLWDDAALFNVIKYIARARHKGWFLEDLKKARVYLDRRIKMEEGDI